MMKKLKLVAMIIIGIISIQNSNAQNNLNTSVSNGLEIFKFELSDNKAIATRNHGKEGFGSSVTIDVQGSRILKNRWEIGLNLGVLKSAYTLIMDKDIHELSEIIGFSSILEEDYYKELYSIDYKNEYFKWGIELKYNFTKDQSRVFQMYSGLGLEHRHLLNSKSRAHYGFHTNSIIIKYLDDLIFGDFSVSGNSRYSEPTEQQTEEIKNYYDSNLSKNTFGVNAKFGIKFQFRNGMSINLEPFLNFMLKNYQSDFIKNHVGIGTNVGFGYQF